MKADANPVVTWFAAHDTTITPIKFPTSTHTALQAAENLNCNINQIAKSILFITASDKPVLVIAAGGNRVDESKLIHKVGEPIRKANKHEVKSITGFEIGGVPPVAHPQPLTTYFDSQLLTWDTIFASAGSPSAIFSINPQHLFSLTSAELLD